MSRLKEGERVSQPVSARRTFQAEETLKVGVASLIEKAAMPGSCLEQEGGRGEKGRREGEVQSGHLCGMGGRERGES